MSNPVVFITGGNSGIGLATALRFADSGCDVSILSRRADENQKAADMVKQRGARCVTYAGDVASAADVGAAIEQTCDELGGLNYAFNNAGIEQLHLPLPKQSEAEFQSVIDTNIKGVWLCMQLEIPRMLDAGGGAIVNTGSVASLIGSPRMPVYAASKHAVLGLSRSVALEYARKNIRVNTVCPAVVQTPMFDRYLAVKPELQEQMEFMHPMGRTGQPEEVADAVYWLCTGATWTTGQAVTVDGGFTAQ